MSRPIPHHSDAELLALLERAEAERKMVHFTTEAIVLEGRAGGHLDDDDYCERLGAWFVVDYEDNPGEER